MKKINKENKENKEESKAKMPNSATKVKNSAPYNYTEQEINFYFQQSENPYFYLKNEEEE